MLTCCFVAWCGWSFSCGMCLVVRISRMHSSHCTCKVSSALTHCRSQLRSTLTHVYLLFLVCAGVHAAVIVADLTDLRSFVDIGRWMAYFTSTTTAASLPFPVLLLANKSDSHDRVLSDTSVSEWSDKHRLTHSYVVSAKAGTGVEEAFRSLVPHIDQFVPAAQPVRAGGSMDATQRLLSLLHSGAGARRSPSHSPSPSHRPSASLTPTSRTRASSLLSSLQPAFAPRIPPAASTPQATVNGVGRSSGYSYSALTVQRLTAAGPHYRSPGASLSTLARQEAKESSRSGSRVEEKEWVAERKQLLTVGRTATPVQSVKPSLTALKVVTDASNGITAKRSPLYSPSTREVDLRF